MQKIEQLLKARAAELLAAGTVERVLAWQSGEFFYDNTPAAAETATDCQKFVYNEFCPANLSKYLIETSNAGKKTAVFLKPCDTYGVNQLLKDNRIRRELVYAIGTPCSGMLDIKKIQAAGVRGITKIATDNDTIYIASVYGDRQLPKEQFLLAKCRQCKGSAYAIADETLAQPLPTPQTPADRFAAVRKLEAMSAAERFAFWQSELSNCIRCNACRDICPACSCEQCIFDNPQAPVAGKANADSAEEQLYHIIRAYHVAGRCTGCGECARVCPQGIHLELLNLKFTKDINSFFGSYQAGADAETAAPQVSYQLSDPEPDSAVKGGGQHV